VKRIKLGSTVYTKSKRVKPGVKVKTKSKSIKPGPKVKTKSKSIKPVYSTRLVKDAAKVLSRLTGSPPVSQLILKAQVQEVSLFTPTGLRV
jgi:hypothetical protein